jgi:hypothetical protein
MGAEMARSGKSQNVSSMDWVAIGIVANGVAPVPVEQRLDVLRDIVECIQKSADVFCDGLAEPAALEESIPLLWRAFANVAVRALHASNGSLDACIHGVLQSLERRMGPREDAIRALGRVGSPVKPGVGRLWLVGARAKFNMVVSLTEIFATTPISLPPIDREEFFFGAILALRAAVSQALPDIGSLTPVLAEELLSGVGAVGRTIIGDYLTRNIRSGSVKLDIQRLAGEIALAVGAARQVAALLPPRTPGTPPPSDVGDSHCSKDGRAPEKPGGMGRGESLPPARNEESARSEQARQRPVVGTPRNGDRLARVAPFGGFAGGRTEATFKQPTSPTSFDSSRRHALPAVNDGQRVATTGTGSSTTVASPFGKTFGSRGM